MGGHRQRPIEVGVISDTHGLVRPEALACLRGVRMIFHAGDVGTPRVLDALAEIAPVRAVRGNVDRGAWADALPEREVIALGGHRILVVHDRDALGNVPAEEGISCVVTGHSHKPHIERRRGVLFLNPGSAGPRRFRLPIALARMRVRPRRIDARIVELG